MPTILACTDGSLYARSIYEHAAWVALRWHGDVHVLHVIERDESRPAADLSGSLGFDAGSELLEELVQLDETKARVARLRGQALIANARQQLQDLGIAHVTSTLRHGSLVENVNEFEARSDILVIGKRGEHADFAHGHLGSNLERVVRSATVPVLVASRAFSPIKNFLFAFDGGPSSLKALHHLCSEPLLQGAVAHLISIGKPGGDLERDFSGAAASLREAGFEVDAEFCQGSRDDRIAEAVARHRADLIVMGAYGHSRIRHLVIGSTTTTVIRTCHVPVLLFR